VRLRDFLPFPKREQRSTVPPQWHRWSWGDKGVPATGIEITPETALTLSSYFCAINVISSDLACLPLKVYQALPDGRRLERRDHPFYRMGWSGSLTTGVGPVTPESGESTHMRVRQAAQAITLGWGNAHLQVFRNGSGELQGCRLLKAGTVTPERRARDNSLYYRAGNGRTLRSDEVIHIAGLGGDGLNGYSVAGYARDALELGKSAEHFGKQFFQNSARPAGLLTTNKHLDGEAQKRLRENWRDMHGGPNVNGVAVLEEGMGFQQLTIPPEDAQFLITRQFQILEVARMFRLAPHKLIDFTQSHLSNIEASNIDHVTTTLMPWCEQWEQELNRKLFTQAERDAGLYIEHDMRALLRGDMAARAEFWTKLRDLGVVSPNQICVAENLEPIGPEGDIRLVPLNMVPLDQAGIVAAAKMAAGGNGNTDA
jgi:HK97 family phage portal protein